MVAARLALNVCPLELTSEFEHLSLILRSEHSRLCVRQWCVAFAGLAPGI